MSGGTGPITIATHFGYRDVRAHVYGSWAAYRDDGEWIVVHVASGLSMHVIHGRITAAQARRIVRRFEARLGAVTLNEVRGLGEYVAEAICGEALT